VIHRLACAFDTCIELAVIVYIVADIANFIGFISG